jgi:UV DNA damage endonuclease
VASWRGVRPTIHYSQSREDLLVDHDPLTAPDFTELQAQKFTKAKLRAHSEMYWNHAQNLWAKDFLSWADIMCEAKQKNYASSEFAKIAFA